MDIGTWENSAWMRMLRRNLIEHFHTKGIANRISVVAHEPTVANDGQLSVTFVSLSDSKGRKELMTGRTVLMCFF